MKGISVLTKWWGNPIDIMLAYRKPPIHCATGAEAEYAIDPCPYVSSTNGFKSADVALISSSWAAELLSCDSDRLYTILATLRSRFDRLIAVDQGEAFSLSLPDSVMSEVDSVIKINGLYKDLDLYNYNVGAKTPDGNWTGKEDPITPEYKLNNLRKLHLSVPFFFRQTRDFRAKIGRLKGDSLVRRKGRSVKDWLFCKLPNPIRKDRPPKYTTHFYADYTHVQRATAVRLLNTSSLLWRGGLTGIQSVVAGLNGIGYVKLSDTDRANVWSQLQREELTTTRLGRYAYNSSMGECKSVL